ncbi:HAD family hydrolase [Pseudonocardia sp. H11422]|uniref:HAD family hydrolase n=1 Tax=Pseudonocardia sp. H11422 TaxID=2835866 RepID=UPI0027E3666F|nr:HAD family hydrolase [Pseudonocardia sp. H11422]
MTSADRPMPDRPPGTVMPGIRSGAPHAPDPDPEEPEPVPPEPAPPQPVPPGPVPFDPDSPGAELPQVVLFDRDGTLVDSGPYCTDPEQVRPMPAARRALELLREAGVAVGVTTTQPGIAHGLIDEADAHAVNQRVEELLGPFSLWRMCPHAVTSGCDCRTPRPGMVLSAAAELGVPPARVVVIGDLGADMAAAAAAGATGVLVPTPGTRPAEVQAAPAVRPDLLAAVRLVLGVA